MRFPSTPRATSIAGWACGVRRAGLTAGLLLAAASAMAGEWVSLFDGRNLDAWRTYRKSGDAAAPAWAIEGDLLAWRKNAGSLVTKETYRDFELELEWRISPGGNSGVMFGVDETSDKPWHTGPELQILDDGVHRDGKNPATSAGALYALFPPLQKAAKPAGEWNALRVKVQGGKIESWLNGAKVVDAQVGSEAWKAHVAKSKFAPFPQFAQVADGRILLQDHNDPVWFRKIRIRRL